jgi:hypothetical protein
LEHCYYVRRRSCIGNDAIQLIDRSKGSEPDASSLAAIHHDDDLSGVGDHVALDGHLSSVHVGQSLFEREPLGIRDTPPKVEAVDELVPFIVDRRGAAPPRGLQMATEIEKPEMLLIKGESAYVRSSQRTLNAQSVQAGLGRPTSRRTGSCSSQISFVLWPFALRAKGMQFRQRCAPPKLPLARLGIAETCLIWSRSRL